MTKLENNKAAGPDNIGPRLLKEIAPVILEPFLYIINLSFTTGVMPYILKVARVVLVYKKGISLPYKIIVLFPYYPYSTKCFKN